MTRTQTILSVTVVSLSLFAAVANTARRSHREELAAFREKALAERKRLGFAPNTDLRGKYPTPEISLEEAVPVRPGGTVELKAEANLVKGSLVQFECDDFEVISLNHSETQVSAKVKAPAMTLPKDCWMRVVSPVSLATVSFPAVRVVGDYTWDLTLANGLKTKFLTKVDDTGELAGDATWTLNGKKLGERPVRIRQREDGVEVSVERNEEDSMATVTAMQEDPSANESNALMAKMETIGRQMEKECFKEGLPQAKAQACMEKYSKQMNELSLQVQQVSSQQREIYEVHPKACTELRLAVAADGTVTGKGLGCVKATREVPVTGKLTVR